MCNRKILRLKFTNKTNKVSITVIVLRDCSGKIILKNEDMDEFLYANWLFATDIELIEDEIDIDSIGELKAVTNNIDGTVCIMNKINELVQAVKQINKEVKKLKEDK